MNFNLTFIGQMIAFGVFVYLTMRYIWPPIVDAMEQRKKSIAEGLDAADRASKDLELAKEKATQELRDAKKEAAGIVEMANKRSNQIIDEAKEQARDEGARLIAAAKSEVEQEANRAREELRKEVSALAIAGAEKILEATVDQDAHNELLSKLATEL